MSRTAQLSHGAVIEPGATSLPATEVGLDDGLVIICLLSISTSLIHALAALDHLDEYALYALFFAVLASLQVAWGVAVFRHATSKLVSTGAVVGLLVAALWVLSRTAGLPIGPQPGHPESVGVIDTIATADEVITALLAYFWIRSQRGRPVPYRLSRLTLLTGGILVALSALALTSTGHGS